MAACLHTRIPHGQSLAGKGERAGLGRADDGRGGSSAAMAGEGRMVTCHGGGEGQARGPTGEEERDGKETERSMFV